MGKTVLILGNGFDLAHELPTKYSHFLDFCKEIIMYSNVSASEKNSFFSDSKILKQFFKIADDIDNNTINKLLRLLSNNIWYKYLSDLYENKKIKGENWIDFESEIGFVIEFLDRNCKDLSMDAHELMSKMKNTDCTNYKFINIFSSMYGRILEPHEKMSIRDFRKKLNEKLENLTEALEIYLSEYATQQPINVISPDIENLELDYVINFNYTDTFSNIYSSINPEFHIHGFCRKDVFVGKTNLVLGIDEYWSKEERDEHTNFTIFKKFAQRIQKRTGIEHINILEEIDYDRQVYGREDDFDNIYIFGHSLDVTDKDILKMFMVDKEDKFKVTIFCRDKETEGEYIANVIKIIGEDNLIKRVNQNPPTIEFIIQSPMVPKTKDETFKSDFQEETDAENNLVAVE